MASITIIPDLPTLESHLSSAAAHTTILLSFHAPWAAPCAQMSTILTSLAPLYTSSALQILTIDAETLPDISESYDVSAVPYLVFLREGKTVETLSGCDAKKVRDTVEKVAGKPNASATKDGVNGQAQQQAIPPALVPGEPAPERETAVTKDLSGYAAPDNEISGAAEGKDTAKPDADPKSTKEELFTRLGALVKAAPVMLFMKGTPSAPQCGFSRQTVALLREHGVRYGFFNILADEDVRQGLKEFADWPTFPQLWVGGELVGGLDIVKEEWQNDPNFLSEYTVNKSNGAVEA